MHCNYPTQVSRDFILFQLQNCIFPMRKYYLPHNLYFHGKWQELIINYNFDTYKKVTNRTSNGHWQLRSNKKKAKVFVHLKQKGHFEHCYFSLLQPVQEKWIIAIRGRKHFSTKTVNSHLDYLIRSPWDVYPFLKHVFSLSPFILHLQPPKILLLMNWSNLRHK